MFSLVCGRKRQTQYDTKGILRINLQNRDNEYSYKGYVRLTKTNNSDINIITIEPNEKG